MSVVKQMVMTDEERAAAEERLAQVGGVSGARVRFAGRAVGRSQAELQARRLRELSPSGLESRQALTVASRMGIDPADALRLIRSGEVDAPVQLRPLGEVGLVTGPRVTPPRAERPRVIRKRAAAEVARERRERFEETGFFDVRPTGRRKGVTVRGEAFDVPVSATVDPGFFTGVSPPTGRERAGEIIRAGRRQRLDIVPGDIIVDPFTRREVLAKKERVIEPDIGVLGRAAGRVEQAKFREELALFRTEEKAAAVPSVDRIPELFEAPAPVVSVRAETGAERLGRLSKEQLSLFGELIVSPRTAGERISGRVGEGLSKLFGKTERVVQEKLRPGMLEFQEEAPVFVRTPFGGRLVKKERPIAGFTATRESVKALTRGVFRVPITVDQSIITGAKEKGLLLETPIEAGARAIFEPGPETLVAFRKSLTTRGAVLEQVGELGALFAVGGLFGRIGRPKFVAEADVAKPGVRVEIISRAQRVPEGPLFAEELADITKPLLKTTTLILTPTEKQLLRRLPKQPPVVRVGFEGVQQTIFREEGRVAALETGGFFKVPFPKKGLDVDVEKVLTEEARKGVPKFRAEARVAELKPATGLELKELTEVGERIGRAGAVGVPGRIAGRAPGKPGRAFVESLGGIRLGERIGENIGRAFIPAPKEAGRKGITVFRFETTFKPQAFPERLEVARFGEITLSGVDRALRPVARVRQPKFVGGVPVRRPKLKAPIQPTPLMEEAKPFMDFFPESRDLALRRFQQKQLERTSRQQQKTVQKLLGRQRRKGKQDIIFGIQTLQPARFGLAPPALVQRTKAPARIPELTAPKQLPFVEPPIFAPAVRLPTARAERISFGLQTFNIQKSFQNLLPTTRARPRARGVSRVSLFQDRAAPSVRGLIDQTIFQKPSIRLGVQSLFAPKQRVFQAPRFKQLQESIFDTSFFTETGKGFRIPPVIPFFKTVRVPKVKKRKDRDFFGSFATQFTPDFSALALGQVTGRQRLFGKFTPFERRLIPKRFLKGRITI